MCQPLDTFDGSEEVISKMLKHISFCTRVGVDQLVTLLKELSGATYATWPNGDLLIFPSQYSKILASCVHNGLTEVELAVGYNSPHPHITWYEGSHRILSEKEQTGQQTARVPWPLFLKIVGDLTGFKDYATEAE